MARSTPSCFRYRKASATERSGLVISSSVPSLVRRSMPWVSASSPHRVDPHRGMVDAWPPAATLESDVDLVGDLRGEVVQRERSQKTEDRAGNALRDEDQVGFTQRL